MLGGLFVILLLITLQTALTCVDSKGCLLEHCVFENFREEYRTIIDVALSKKKDCPYALGTSRQQNLRSDQTKTIDYNIVTCQPDFQNFAKERTKVETLSSQIDLTSRVKTALAALVASNSKATADAKAAETLLLLTDLATAPYNFSASTTLQVPVVTFDPACTNDIQAAKSELVAAVKDYNQRLTASEFIVSNNFTANLNNCASGFWKDTTEICP